MTWDPHTALYSNIMFEKGEGIVLSVPCDILDPDMGTMVPGGVEKLVRDLKASFYRFPGVMVVTNRRLLFLTKQGGSGRGDDHRLRDEVRLENLQCIGVGSQSLGGQCLSVIYNDGGRVRERAIKGANLDANWLAYTQQHIMVLKQARLKEMEEERRRERVQYVIDFSFLKTQLEKGGLAVTAVKCPNCGASVDIPAQGEYFTCQYCKSAIHAMDVFEKMKGLLQGL